ncbi:ester hydrolase C11orf54 homolog [Melanaphis sacchari]|uniref:ester hydrolase C11orf54 homolog n=1 Tax=Melanaphis sacchari TaxID=742174 RepID=UPI000DC14CBE|nr:ester hydrolase C11orf54 homolog [Melanaphis sacchari]
MATENYNFPSTLNINELPVVHIKLNTPPLSCIVKAILPELLKNYENASAEVVQCPDLTQPPFNLVSEGLSGNENVFDIGEITNMIPSIKREKLYNIKDLKQITGSDPLVIFGACAGPYPFLGIDSECVVNVKMTGDQVENGTHAHMTKSNDDPECCHKMLPNDEMRFSFLANFFTSNGFKGEVLKIVCEVRKGPLSFSMCIREALVKHFGDEIIAIGGVIFIENGKVKVHVIKPSFMKKPSKSEKELENLVHFIELSPPLAGVGCIVSHNPGLNLRFQHFHLYSDHNQGGHYHNDTEPNTIKYTGYFGVSKQFTKID